MKAQLISITPEPEALIARCARVSHRSEGRGPEVDRKLIRRLIELGHDSVLEHAAATFEITGISRACANQLTRHRLASFVQESQRYVDAHDRPLVRPKSFSDADWERASGIYDSALALYKDLVSQGIPREDARFVLPIGAETRLVLTANFRELRHILRLRLTRSAQWEIREMARQMLAVLLAHAPSVFENMGGTA